MWIDPKEGEVWLCTPNIDDLMETSIQKGTRPFLVLSKTGRFYRVIALTSKIKKPDLPVHYVIEDWKEQGLKERSMLMAEQMFSFTWRAFDSFITTLDDRTLKKAREISLISLGIVL